MEEVFVFFIIIVLLFSMVMLVVSIIETAQNQNRCDIACKTLGYHTGNYEEEACLCFEAVPLEDAR